MDEQKKASIEKLVLEWDEKNLAFQLLKNICLSTECSNEERQKHLIDFHIAEAEAIQSWNRLQHEKSSIS